VGIEGVARFDRETVLPFVKKRLIQEFVGLINGFDILYP
jgi:hypothetical protein